MDLMSADRKKQLVQCLGGLAAVLKGSLSADALSIWEVLLRPYPIEVIQAASLKLAQTLQFMPVPAEMIQACKAEAAQREMAELRGRCNINQLLRDAKSVPAELSDGRGAAMEMAKSLAQINTTPTIVDYERRAKELQKQAIQMRDDAVSKLTKNLL